MAMPANGKVHDLKALRTLIKSWIFPLLVWKQDVKWLAERVNASFWSSDEGTLQKVSHLKHNIVDLLPSIADLPARRSLQCGRRRRKSGWYKTFRTSWTSSKCLMHLQFMSFTQRFGQYLDEIRSEIIMSDYLTMFSLNMKWLRFQISNFHLY